jgi:prepilin-type N-terminal cleavage/methylation domain-containing protein
VSSRSSKHGFTLIELSIVLAVSGVLATMVWPVVKQAAFDRVTDEVVAEVMSIQEAARWAYIDPPNGIPRWPGSTSPDDCDADAGAKLVQDGYLDPAALLRNPWGFAYSVRVIEGDPLDATASGHCHLRVWTQIHIAAYLRFHRRLPASGCDEPVGDFRSCWADIPPPGNVLPFPALEAWCPSGSQPGDPCD